MTHKRERCLALRDDYVGAAERKCYRCGAADAQLGAGLGKFLSCMGSILANTSAEYWFSTVAAGEGVAIVQKASLPPRLRLLKPSGQSIVVGCSVL